MKNLRKERIIATLWGCIHSRLKKKQVLWNNARFIPLQYNEEHAEILLCSKKEKLGVAKGDNELIERMGKIEDMLQPGEREILTTQRKQRMKVLLVEKMSKSRHSYEEYIHFHAQMQTEQVLTKITLDGRDLVNKDEVFSLMEFVFVPLKPLRDNIAERGRDEQVCWLKFDTFDRQCRPFTIGVLQQKACERPEKGVQALIDCEETLLKELKSCEVAYSAAWPLQAYISGFRVSNSISISYTQEEERWDPAEWIEKSGDDETPDEAAHKVNEDVILKINGVSVSVLVLDFHGSAKRVRMD